MKEISTKCNNNDYANRLRRSGLTEDAIGELVRKREQRRIAKMEKQGRFPEVRRCIWEETASNGLSVRCISFLCSYNPGPYCFMHAAVIESRAMENMANRLESKRRVTQALMRRAS